MDWLTAFSVVALMAGVTISTVVLVAVGSIRRTLNEGTLRQSQQIRRLSEAVAALNHQNQVAQTRIQALTEANRRLSDDLAALGERVAERDADRTAAGIQRLLH
ncbi:hypothetical protein [Azospirillum halopraeferens]|uniref:hypothetical protein n=1 Tax=Azospirillum halopraeferens TaxID=34010 RepID=UPI000402E48D|nr:hypothetical protein [Azospirillum halopraeferens]